MSARSFVFTVDTDGAMECLWTDDLPLAQIGTLEITRASKIEFNDFFQQWEVYLPENACSPIFRHPSRAACLAWEHDEVNRRLANGENPYHGGTRTR